MTEVRKNIDYNWHLAELMARAGMHNSTDLLPHLKERGIDLSPSQIYRLVTGKPERVSLHFLAAVCDIFEVTLDDLVSYTASTVRSRRARATPNVVDIDKTLRPRRARILPDDD